VDLEGSLPHRLISGAANFAFRRAVILGPLPSSAPIIFAANHPTTLDPLLLQFAAGRRLAMLILNLVFRVPIVGRLLAAAGHIQVRPDDGQRSVSAAVASLGSGRSVGIFPEGCLSPNEGIATLRTGAVRIAASAGVPIIPVGIWHDPERTLTIQTKLGGSKKIGRYNLSGACVVELGQPLLFDVSPEDRPGIREASSILEAEIRGLASRCEAIGSRMKRYGNSWLFGPRLIPVPVR
jgi:1-acyl-sn-glycerol-3-phosphate acyltransferase